MVRADVVFVGEIMIRDAPFAARDARRPCTTPAEVIVAPRCSSGRQEPLDTSLGPLPEADFVAAARAWSRYSTDTAARRLATRATGPWWPPTPTALRPCGAQVLDVLKTKTDAENLGGARVRCHHNALFQRFKECGKRIARFPARRTAGRPDIDAPTGACFADETKGGRSRRF